MLSQQNNSTTINNKQFFYKLQDIDFRYNVRISYDKPTETNPNAKIFTAFHTMNEFISWYRSLNDCDKHVHEVPSCDSCIPIIIDYDIKQCNVDNFDDYDKQEVEFLLEDICNKLHQILGVTHDPVWYISTACRKDKISFHMHILSIRCKLSQQKYLIRTIIDLFELDNNYIWLNDNICALDLAIYRKNGNFRCIDSSKIGCPESIIQECKCSDNLPYEQHFIQFIDIIYNYTEIRIKKCELFGDHQYIGYQRCYYDEDDEFQVLSDFITIHKKNLFVNTKQERLLTGLNMYNKSYLGVLLNDSTLQKIIDFNIDLSTRKSWWLYSAGWKCLLSDTIDTNTEILYMMWDIKSAKYDGYNRDRNRYIISSIKPKMYYLDRLLIHTGLVNSGSQVINKVYEKIERPLNSFQSFNDGCLVFSDVSTLINRKLSWQEVDRFIQDTMGIIYRGSPIYITKEYNISTKYHEFVCHKTKPKDIHFLLPCKKKDSNDYEDKKISISKIIERNKEYITYKHFAFIPSFDTIPDIINQFIGFHQKIGEYDITNISNLLEFIKYTLCGNDEQMFKYTIDWLAHIIQHPDKKTMSCLVFISQIQGIGKNWFFRFFGEKVLGNRYYTLCNNFDDLMNKFNARFATKLLVLLDEMTWGGNKREANRLKSLISEQTSNMEKKGFDSIDSVSYTNYVILTNNDFPIHIESSDRRYAVMSCNCDKANDVLYLKRAGLDNDLVAYTFYNYLLSRNIEAWHPSIIPITQVKKNIQEQASSPVKQFLMYLSELDDCMPEYDDINVFGGEYRIMPSALCTIINTKFSVSGKYTAMQLKNELAKYNITQRVCKISCGPRRMYIISRPYILI